MMKHLYAKYYVKYLYWKYNPVLAAVKEGTNEEAVKIISQTSLKTLRNAHFAKTPLLALATQREDPAVLEALLSAGLSIEDGTSGKVPLPAAVALDFKVHHMETLLQHGLNPNYVLPGGTSIFMLATTAAPLYGKPYDILDLLLKAGADINHKSQDGETALHSLTMVQDPTYIDVAIYLLEKGADPHLTEPLFGHNFAELFCEVNTLDHHTSDIEFQKSFTKLKQILDEKYNMKLPCN